MSATPANSQASLEAAKNGRPYHICISTTPGDLNTEHGRYAKSFFDRATNFTEEMYDWTMEKVKNYIESNSVNGFVYIEYSYRQLGRTEEWFKKQCRALNMDLFKIKREILLQWNKSSDLSPFSEAEMVRLSKHITEPVTTLMLCGCFPLYIYNSNFNWRSTLLIGVDVATGMSLDATAITIWDPSSGEIVATLRNNVIDGFELQNILVELVGLYFTNSILILERNSAHAIIANLLRTPIAKNLFYEKKETKIERKVNDVKRQKFETKLTKVYGVSTDSKTRPLMIDLLRDVVQFEYDKLHSKELIEEIGGLERHKDNKIEHGEGGHDDLVFSFLVLRYVWAYGTNLGNWMLSKQAIAKGQGINDASNEQLRRFSAVASLNSKDSNKNLLNNVSGDIIRDWNQKQNYDSMKRDKESLDNNRFNAFRNIMNMNSKRDY